ncbi:hypothetical protein [Hyphococcus luteus]|uniref:Uncharacterized protein n=1 Tax=Hyphococcus luteus TaxID=2058213 RepID=A0A2S7K0Y0_9PROT|nr:hypothetical protein [Marinicaulis flavus]PQA86159.1 hypothetical protein CW354_17525 [Marinicaulis flavus]
MDTFIIQTWRILSYLTILVSTIAGAVSAGAMTHEPIMVVVGGVAGFLSGVFWAAFVVTMVDIRRQLILLNRRVDAGLVRDYPDMEAELKEIRSLRV